MTLRSLPFTYLGNDIVRFTNVITRLRGCKGTNSLACRKTITLHRLKRDCSSNDFSPFTAIVTLDSSEAQKRSSRGLARLTNAWTRHLNSRGSSPATSNGNGSPTGSPHGTPRKMPLTLLTSAPTRSPHPSKSPRPGKSPRHRRRASSPPPLEMPQFLHQSPMEIQKKFVDLEWQQRQRLLAMNDSPSEWERLRNDEILKRNRYLNIDPWSKNRIILKVPSNCCDYINASPINLKCTKNGLTMRYVATQGPKEASLNHVWRMIWDEGGDTSVVIMLTQTHESGREKCFQYFPADLQNPIIRVNEANEFGDGFLATVELIEHRFDKLTRSNVRKLKLTSGKKSKTVWHYLFDGWPDFLIPENEDRAALLELIQEMNEHAGDSALPRFVHCSAGVGRTGTFIALDYLLQELKDGAFESMPQERDPIAETVNELRKQRMMMVQGDTQFEFLYDFMKEQWRKRHGLLLQEKSRRNSTESAVTTPSDSVMVTAVEEQPPEGNALSEDK